MKKPVENASQVGSKKQISEIHAELGFGPVPLAYSPSTDGTNIDPELARELVENGLVCRFINAKEYRRKGFHPSKWVPYKRTSRPRNGALFNVDPDGYTVNQDLILAVKPVDWNEAHRKYLQEKANRLVGAAQTEASDALRKSLAASGLKSKVVDGYEDDK